MYTECPTCYTLFRVTTAQLKSADGRVRCGHCDDVFNAIAYLTDEVPADAQVTEAYASAESIASARPDMDAISMLSSFDRQPPPSSATSRNASLNSISTLGSSSVGAHEERNISAAYRAAADDVIEQALAGASGSSGSKAESRSESKSAFDLGGASEPVKGKSSSSGKPITIIDDIQDEGSAEQFVLEELKEGGTRKSLGWTITAGWSLLIGLLVVVLFGQFVYFKRADLNKYATGRMVVDAVCTVIKPLKSCDEVMQRDLQAIEVMDRDVRSHPNTKGALLITATIRNKATYQQPFPDLELSFSDINQKLLAQRRFKPEEYLSPEIDIGAGMKANLPLRVQIELVDPGAEAVNFEFNFR